MAQPCYSNPTQDRPARRRGHHQIPPPTFWLEDGFNVLQKGLFHERWGRAAHPHREVFAVHIEHDGVVLGWDCRRERRDLLSHGTDMRHTQWGGNEWGGQDTPSAMLWPLLSPGVSLSK